MFSKLKLSILCVILLGSAVLVYAYTVGQTKVEDSETVSAFNNNNNEAVQSTETASAVRESEQAHVSQGKITNQDERAEQTVPGIKPDSYYAPKPGDPFGKVKPVPADTNKTVAAVHKAIQPATRDASQLTVLAEPKPWDRDAYVKDPEAYTGLSVPARAFRPAQPAKGVPRLQRIGASSIEMKQDETVSLRVRTEPFMPVTFTSMDMGRFANQLTSQTVAADKTGIATVSFIGGTGTLYDVDIHAASPVASGTLRWVVHILPTVDAFADMNAAAQQQGNVKAQ